MQIADHGFGFETVEAAEVVNRALESTASFERVEIADVLAEENILSDGDGDRVFQMTADGEYWRQTPVHANAERGITACTPQNSRPTARETHDGVIARADDGAVVHQKMIGNIFQARRGFFIADRDGLVAAVATGCDQRTSALFHEQVM